MEFKIIKKADIVLFFVLLAVGLTISWASLNSGQTGDKVRISVGGETYGVYDLAQDRTIQVRQNGHTNNIIIEGGHVLMASSDCANQVCVNTGAIYLAGDSIVCLPNRVMVEILSESKGGGVDVISG